LTVRILKQRICALSTLLKAVVNEACIAGTNSLFPSLFAGSVAIAGYITSLFDTLGYGSAVLTMGVSIVTLCAFSTICTIMRESTMTDTRGFVTARCS